MSIKLPTIVDKQQIAAAVQNLISDGEDKQESIRLLRRAGYNDIKLKEILSDSGHSPEDIVSLMKDVGRM